MSTKAAAKYLPPKEHTKMELESICKYCRGRFTNRNFAGGSQPRNTRLYKWNCPDDVCGWCYKPKVFKELNKLRKTLELIASKACSDPKHRDCSKCPDCKCVTCFANRVLEQMYPEEAEECQDNQQSSAPDAETSPQEGVSTAEMSPNTMTA